MNETLPSEMTLQRLPCLPPAAPSSGPNFLTRPRARLLALAPRGFRAARLHLWLLQLDSSHRSCPVLLRRFLFLSVPADNLGVALAGLWPSPGMARAPLASLCAMHTPEVWCYSPQLWEAVPKGALRLSLAGQAGHPASNVYI